MRHFRYTRKGAGMDNEEVSTCGGCGVQTTPSEREVQTGKRDRCPGCNGYVGKDKDNCRVAGGGCGE